MFSSLRNLANNLQYSQRFQNNNFAYYNDYQTRADYQNDLTKMFYNCTRKTIPVITLFSEAMRHPSRAIQLSGRPAFKTLDNMLHRFYAIFNENNYSDMKDDLDEFKYRHAVRYYPDEFEFLKSTSSGKFASKCKIVLKSYQELVRGMRDKSEKCMAVCDRMDMEQADAAYLQNVFAAEQLLLRNLAQVQNTIKSYPDEQTTIKNMSLFTFKLVVEQMLDQMTSAQVWPVLVLTIPYSPWFRGLINPLTIALHGFMEQEHVFRQTREKVQDGVQSPRMVFINLDGNDSYLNLRAVKLIKGPVLYITVVREPNVEDLEEHQQIINMSLSHALYSEVSFSQKEVDFQQEHAEFVDEDSDSKILLFPLNSAYLREEYSKKHPGKKLPQFGTSQDILFLFQQAIYSQIRDFTPNAILLSYSGQLPIQQQHFNEITRNLTILSDHRLLLFPNLSDLLRTRPNNQIEEQDIDDTQSFLSKYTPSNFDTINQERFFNNIAMFVKLTAGAYSLQQRSVMPEHSRYFAGRRYQYLEKVFSFEFGEWKKLANRFWKSQELTELLQKQKRVLLEINAAENEPYGTIIDQQISILAEEENIGDIENQMAREKTQLMFGRTEGKLGQWLQRRKEDLLLENIFETRVSKVYYEMSDGKTNKVKALKFRMHGTEDSEQMHFQKYTQFFFNDTTGIVIVLNHRKSQFRHINLYGNFASALEPRSQQTAIELKPIPDDPQTSKQPQLLFVNYSHCFHNTSTKNALYLIWPMEYNVSMAVQCKLLEVEYRPQLANRVVRIQFTMDSENQGTFNFAVLTPKDGGTGGGAVIRPRYGCSCHAKNPKNIYIFGGIYADVNDFLCLPPGITRMQVTQKTFQFKQDQKDSKRGYQLRPKMFYTITPILDNVNTVSLLRLSGGFGRDHTNTFSIFSCFCYDFNMQKNQLTRSRHPMRTIRIPGPLQTRKAGYFNVLLDDRDLTKLTQKFSIGVKDKFIFDESSRDVKASQGEIMSFVDQNYRVSEFKTEHRRMYLFGVTRKSKEQLYMGGWVPELYVNDGVKTSRVELGLLVCKQKQLQMPSYIFPPEDSILCMGLHDNKIYVLACSTFTSHNICLYSSDLSTLSQTLLNEQMLKLNIIHTFRHLQYTDYTPYSFHGVSMCFDDEAILLVGGTGRDTHKRYDVVLEKKRQKYVCKFRRVRMLGQEGEKGSVGLTMEMMYPCPVAKGNAIYYYSLSRSNGGKGWYVRIQMLEPTQKVIIRQGSLNIMAIDYKQYQRGVVETRLSEPYFSKIMKYDEFSNEYLNLCMDKLQQALNNRLREINNEMQQQQESSQQQQLDKDLLKQALQILKTVKNSKCQLKDMDILHQKLKKLRKRLKSYRQAQQSTELLTQLNNVSTLIQKKQLQDCCLANPPQTLQHDDLYRFILEDREDGRRVKYFAIGNLGQPCLNFVRVKFRHEMLLCQNQKSDETVFYNLNEGICNEFSIVRTQVKFVEAVEEGGSVQEAEAVSEYSHDMS